MQCPVASALEREKETGRGQHNTITEQNISISNQSAEEGVIKIFTYRQDSTWLTEIMRFAKSLNIGELGHVSKKKHTIGLLHL